MCEFSKRLQIMRQKVGMTQAEVADRLHMTGGGYANYEHGLSYPSIGNVAVLAELLHTSVQYLLTGEEAAEQYEEEQSVPFCERLRELRKQKKLSQKAMAEELNIRRESYQRYEYGTYEPKWEHFMQLAKLFGVTPDTLAGRNKK